MTGFVALRPLWETLSSQAETASPFNSWVWLTTWWEVFGAGKELRIFVVRDGDTVTAIAPFYIVVFRLGPVRLRVLLQLGFGNDLTERLETLVLAGRRVEALERLSVHLAHRCKSLWDIMIWNGVRTDDLPPSLRRLVHEDYPNPYEVGSLPDSWDKFVTDLNKSMRDNVKYYPRLLQRHGHQMSTRIATTTEEISPAVSEFLRLHHLRSLALSMPQHDDRFGEPLHRQFFERIAVAFAEQGKLRIALLAVDGVNVAAQVAVEDAGTLCMYYSGFDPRWHKYSVGMIATAACIHDAIERDIRQIDLLKGSGQFKQRWGTRTTHISRLTMLRDSTAIRLFYSVYRRSQDLIVHQANLPSRHGLGPRHRLTRWISGALGQPTIG